MLAAVTSFQYRFGPSPAIHMKKSGGQISLPSSIFTQYFYDRTSPLHIMSKSLQTIFERLSDLARELLAIRFIEDTVS
jgi:hypothetical protein